MINSFIWPKGKTIIKNINNFSIFGQLDMTFMYSYALGFLIISFVDNPLKKANKILLISSLGTGISFLYLPL